MLNIILQNCNQISRLCAYDDDGMILFYSLGRKGIYKFDLNKPGSTPIRWSHEEININPEYLNLFIWLNYDKANDECLLVHTMSEEEIGCYFIKNDQKVEFEPKKIRNPNFFLKEGNRLFIASNTESKNFPIYMINNNGKNF